MKNDHAVSPVIGVMLMIVVTIIIAAIVSAFAGSMGNSEHTVPTTALTVTPSINCNGTIEFHATGGSELNLTDTAIELDYGGRTITLSNSDQNSGPSSSGTPSGTSCPTRVAQSIPYLMEEGGGGDGYISAGDRFVLTADENDATDQQFIFEPVVSTGVNTTFAIPYNVHVSYMVIDKPSGKAVQTGEFVLRNS